MGSIKAPSLCFHLQLHTLHLPKTKDNCKPFYISLKSPLWIITSPHSHRNPCQFPVSMASPKIPLYPVSHRPTSSLYQVQKTLSRSISENIVVSLVAALLFLGSFGVNARVSLAQPVQASNSRATMMNDRKDSQMGSIEAEEMYEKLLQKEPQNVEVLKVVVYSKMRRGQTKDALKYVGRLVEIDPEEIEWKLLEAFCYEMMGQLSNAKMLFTEILKENPLLVRALHGLAMVMHKNVEGHAVFEMLNKALQLARQGRRTTEERNIIILMAQMHLLQGDLKEALKRFEDLVNENPRDFRPYLFQGIIYSLLDRKDEAAEHFKTYQSLVPEEFPQRRFLDDLVMAAKPKSRELLQKELEVELSCRK
ncbi:hypothetical protein K2173_026514 [Erythroxylum novogranatense]|uniref:Chloroplast lumen common family protein n=1 Tax=Erythroxylum novogranatense TaxID=1862640 RepID=A0AAV8TWB6_9ROSI|nr:hypothetical protein K2173_026514 [Erythroxylum novogranatense]